MIDKIKNEPVLTWGTGNLSVNVVQLLAIPMPHWLHIVLLILTSFSATVGARQQVTPVSRAAATAIGQARKRMANQKAANQTGGTP
jgi:hypothetical protein